VKVDLERVYTADFVVKAKSLCDWLHGLVGGSAHALTWLNHGMKTLFVVREVLGETPFYLMILINLG